jgi:hypothetical protein
MRVPRTGLSPAKVRSVRIDDGGECAPMLREIANVRPEPDGTRRRWFSSPYFDLFLFLDAAGGRVTGFHLCYDREGDEHAIVWDGGKAVAHYRVDSCEAGHISSLTPILVEARAEVNRDVLERFERESRAVDREIATVVRCGIEKCIRR